MTDHFSIFVSSAPGLEPLLYDEMKALGLLEGAEGEGQGAAIVVGGVELVGDVRTLYRANLELGLATHIRVRVGELKTRHLSELERASRRFPWERWLRRGMRFRVEASARRSRLYHTGAIAERVARAIEAKTGATAEREASHRVLVRFDQDCGVFSIETSGEPLYRRGYRGATAKAPLSPDLARALLVVSGWDRISPLVDPMMGSGTIPIEAAILARRLPPGAHRRFAFMDFADYDEALFLRVREAAIGASLPALPFRVHGSDRDAGAVQASIDNAARALVRDDLELERRSLSDALTSWPTSSSVAVVSNPPYGKRIGGDPSSLRSLYQRFGQLLRALPLASPIALAAGDPRLARAAGIPLRTALTTDHGGLKVSLMVSSSGRREEP